MTPRKHLSPELEDHVINGLIGDQWFWRKSTVEALYHEIIELREFIEDLIELAAEKGAQG